MHKEPSKLVKYWNNVKYLIDRIHNYGLEQLNTLDLIDYCRVLINARDFSKQLVNYHINYKKYN